MLFKSEKWKVESGIILKVESGKWNYFKSGIWKVESGIFLKVESGKWNFLMWNYFKSGIILKVELF